ncbi:hypothetical protein ACP6C7_14360 [Mycolicibacterium septicum]|uniref:Glycosyltransferase family 28 N-terminal domain-containing protein n=1 Tax=Mycolicibacterium septicum TaxID=98668 RepID=A0ABW9M1S2_9MYCO
MTRIVFAAFGTRGDVAPLTGLGVRLRDQLGAEVIIAAQHPYENLVTAAGLGYRPLPGDTEADTRASSYGQAVVDGARMRPSKDVLAQMRDDLSGVGEAIARAAADADLLLLEGPVGSLLGYHVCRGAGRTQHGGLLSTRQCDSGIRAATTDGTFLRARWKPPGVAARRPRREGVHTADRRST